MEIASIFETSSNYGERPENQVNAVQTPWVLVSAIPSVSDQAQLAMPIKWETMWICF
jgi:hypothetical protein